MLLQFQSFHCRSVSVDFERKTRGFGLSFLDKHVRLPVFVVIGCCEDVAATKREVLSALEHFSQIHGSHLSTQAANPGVPVGIMGGRQ